MLALWSSEEEGEVTLVFIKKKSKITVPTDEDLYNMSHKKPETNTSSFCTEEYLAKKRKEDAEIMRTKEKIKRERGV